MQCEVKEESPAGILGIEIKNGRGIVVAQSLINQNEPLGNHLKQVGRYSITVPIPADILWEGEYTVHPVYFDKKMQKILHEEVSLKMPVFSEVKSSSHIGSGAFEGTILKTAWSITHE